MIGIAALLPLLADAAPFVVLAAEKVFGLIRPGVKSGPDKFATAINFLRRLTEIIDPNSKEPVTDDALAGIVQSAFAGLKAAGKLTPSASADEAMYLVIGRVVPLKEKTDG